MNRLAGILFLVLWLLNLMGNQFQFYIEKYNWNSFQQNELKQEIPTSFLRIIEMNKQEYRRCYKEKNQKEILFNGNYYDIVKIVKKGSNIEIKCVEDGYEKVLLSNYIKGKFKKNKEHSKSFKYSLCDNYIEATNGQFLFYSEKKQEIGRWAIQFWKESNSVKRTFPPPQTV